MFDSFDSFKPTLDYCVDVTFVVDATESMRPYLEAIKEQISGFFDAFQEEMKAKARSVSELRVRVIPFRDYQFNGDRAVDASCPFYSLPEETDALGSYVDSIRAEGGGDEPESALEALALAMRAPWTTKGGRRRHIIYLFNDAPAVPLRDPARMENPAYPPNMPAGLEELGDMWHGRGGELGGMPDRRAARMILIAPNRYPWNEISMTWINVLAEFSEDGCAAKDLDLQGLCKMLSICI